MADGLPPQVANKGTAPDRPLTEWLDNHRQAGDICGRALFRGIGVVAVRAIKAPFDPTLTLHARFRRLCWSRSLACSAWLTAPWTGHDGGHAAYPVPWR